MSLFNIRFTRVYGCLGVGHPFTGESLAECGVAGRPVDAVGRGAALELGAGRAHLELSMSVACGSHRDWDGDSGGECGKGNTASC